MAVTISAGGYMRSDFMISDAALPIRFEEFQQEQATEFAKILESFDNTAVSSGSMTVNRTADMGDVESGPLDSAVSGIKMVSNVSIEQREPLGSLGVGEVKFEDCDKQTQQALLAASLPDDPRALMRMVLRGDIKLSDIPEDKLSPEFLMLLALIMRTNPELLEEALEGKESAKTNEGEDEETVKESDFDYDKLLDEQLINQDQLMAMLLNVPVDKTDEMDAITTDPKKLVEEIVSVDKQENPLLSWSNHLQTEAAATQDFNEQLDIDTELSFGSNIDNSMNEVRPSEEPVPVEDGFIQASQFEGLKKVDFQDEPQPLINKKTVVAEMPVMPRDPITVQRQDGQPAVIRKVGQVVDQNDTGVSVAVRGGAQTVEKTEEVMPEAVPNLSQTTEQNKEVVLAAAPKSGQISEQIKAEVLSVSGQSAEQNEAEAVSAVQELGQTVVQNESAVYAETIAKVTNADAKSVADTLIKTRDLNLDDVGQFAAKIVTQVAAKPVAHDESAGMEQESNSSDSGQMLFNARQPAREVNTSDALKSENIADTKAAVFEVNQNKTVESKQVETRYIKPETAKPIQSGKTAQPEVKPLIQSRVKSATEELAILKGAKSKTEPSDESAELPQPTHTANPLVSDEPIVFLRDGERVEVRPSEILSQATARLVETASDMPKGGDTEYSLELNPEELGKITVKMTKAADGAVSVTIAAENARTRRVLEENSGVMQDNLRNNGVRLESWQTVNESDRDNRAQDYNGSAKNPYHHENNPRNEENENDGTFAELIASM